VCRCRKLDNDDLIGVDVDVSEESNRRESEGGICTYLLRAPEAVDQGSTWNDACELAV
jgi:hypothetical protein